MGIMRYIVIFLKYAFKWAMIGATYFLKFALMFYKWATTKQNLETLWVQLNVMLEIIKTIKRPIKLEYETDTLDTSVSTAQSLINNTKDLDIAEKENVIHSINNNSKALKNLIISLTPEEQTASIKYKGASVGVSTKDGITFQYVKNL